MPELAVLAPLALLLLPLAVGLGLLDGWRAPGRRRRFGAALRGLLLCLLVLALARPVLRSTTPLPQSLHLVDVSDSIPPSEQARALAAVRAAAAAGGAHRLVLFAEDALLSPIDGQIEARAATLPGAGTDLDGGLALALAALPPTGAARLWLYSDGEATTPLSATTRAALEARGLAIDPVPLDPSSLAPPLISLSLPTAPLAPGATARLQVTVAGGPAGRTGTLTLRLDGDVKLQPVLQLAAGETRVLELDVEIPQNEDQGLISVEVELDGDRILGALRRRQAPVAWLVGSRAAELSVLSAALSAEGFQIRQILPGDLAEDGLADVDLVVLAGPPTAAGPGRPAALPPGFVAALDPYVRSGGGLLVTGGEFAYDQGGWDRSPLAALLPVRLDPQGEEEDATLTLIIALDKSGSMAQSAVATAGRTAADIGARMGTRSGGGSKIQVVARAAIAAVELLRPEDSVGVLGVDTKPTWAVPLQSAAQRVRVMDGILGIGAGGGGIFVYSALQEARSAFQRSQSRLRHLILFADTSDVGEQDDPVSGESALRLVGRMADEDGITLSVIGIGRDGDKDAAFLRELARRGKGRFVRTDSVNGLKTLFMAETERVLGEGLEETRPFRPQVVGAHPALAGVDLGRAPALGGMNRVLRQDRARTLLTGPDDRPLLAHWRLGLGQVAAWTADTGHRWARGWPAWEGSQRLWTQLARALARDEDGVADFILEREGEEVFFTRRGPDGLSQPSPGLRVVLEVGGQERLLDPIPDEPGRSRLRLAVPEGEAFRLAIQDDDGPLASLEGRGLPSPERRSQAVATAALNRLARTGTPAPDAPAPRPLARLLLGGPLPDRASDHGRRRGRLLTPCPAARP